MKLGFTLLTDYSGIATYARHLLEELAHYPDLELHLYTSFRRKAQLTKSFQDSPRFHYRNIFPHDLMLGKALSSVTKAIQHAIWISESFNIDVIHHTNPFFVPKRVIRNTVVTVHDIFPLYMKVLPGVKEMMEQKHKPIFEDSRLIFVPTQFVKQDIQQRLGISEEKMRVTYESASPQFKPVAPNWALLKKYDLTPDTPFFFHIGRMDYRKNLPRMIEAYFALPQHLKTRVHFVVATSGDTTELQQAIERGKKHGDGGSVKVISNLPFEDLLHLYNTALGFMFVSLAEGFGIPLLEAMQCGCPVITSTETSLPEIAGDAALLVNPHDTDAITRAMQELIESPELRQTLKQKGLERAKQFSWKKMAEETLNGYKYAMKR
jgi:glycosyltransferase involved in cell wall biosynthesis